MYCTAALHEAYMFINWWRCFRYQTGLASSTAAITKQTPGNKPLTYATNNIFTVHEQCTENHHWSSPCHYLLTGYVKKHGMAWERNTDYPEEWHHYPHSLGRTVHHPAETAVDPWKQGLVAPQAAEMSLLVAGTAQWLCFVCHRWQRKSFLHASWFTCKSCEDGLTHT